MRRFVLYLALSLAAHAVAGSGSSAASVTDPTAPGGRAATAVVSTAHVDVLFDDAALEPYAQQVAAAAEVELLRVAALFGRAPFPVTFRIEANVDVFNAFALPLPRPHVVLRAITPLHGVLGRRGDLLARVLRHELTHLVQLTDTRVPPGAPQSPSVGLVGEGTAVLPPAWFLEGVAVWVESQAGDGGRLDAPRTRALLWTLAADDALPTLTEASLITYAAWPGGETRYLVGAAFVDALVVRHGWQAVLDTLRVFQAGGRLRSFASSWRTAVGTELASEWSEWQRSLAAAAAAQTWADRPQPITGNGGRTGAAALSPDGRRLAWRDDEGVWLADLQGGRVEGARLVRRDLTPESMTWLDADTLVWSAVARDPGARPMDLFALDLNSQRLRRLTWGAHAHLPRADGQGCVLYVSDTVAAGSAVKRWCREATGLVWRAEPGSHVVGLAVGADGRVAMSLAREAVADGPAVRLYLLTREGAVPLGGERRLGNAVDPAWDGPSSLLVSGDARGVPQVYRLLLQGGPMGTASGVLRADRGAVGATPARAWAAVKAVVPLSRALGGADEPLATPNGVLARSLSGKGQDLVWLSEGLPLDDLPSSRVVDHGGSAGPVARRLAAERVPALKPNLPSRPGPYPVTPYSVWPSLLPYGWLPTGGRLAVAPFGAGLEVLVPALDDSGRHAIDLRLGYDSGLRGPLAGAYGSLRYAWNMPNLIPATGAPPPFGAAVQLGGWPHAAHLQPVSEVAYGVRAEVLMRMPVDRFAGSFGLRIDLVRAASLPDWSLEGRLDAVLNRVQADRFGVPSGGAAVALRGRWTASDTGTSRGLWGEARWLPSVGDVPLAFAVRAGYRPVPAVPVTLPDWAAMASVGTRWSLPVQWRWDDGLLALERIDLEPTLRLWGGVEAAPGIGLDMALWADTVVDYNGIVRLGLRGGYADGWWAALAFGWPY